MMATFRKGFNARVVLGRRIVLGSVAVTEPAAKVSWYLDPSDALTLRGIPAVGRGVAGAIRGTKPEACVERLDGQARS